MNNEFVESVYNDLKTRLGVTDLNLNKLGFTGFFIELLGNIQSDSKNYYDFLFNEAFPVSATNISNLMLHGQLFGFVPELAKPATINGYFILNGAERSLPSDVHRREIVFSNIDIDVDGLNFNLDAKYYIEILRTENRTLKITATVSSAKTYDVYPILLSNPKIPINGLTQVLRKSQTFYLTNYAYGQHYIHTLNLKDDSLANLRVYVRERNTTEFVEYAVKNNKNIASPDEKSVYYTVLPNNQLRLEFGSGVRGRFIPSAEVRLELFLTQGYRGNIQTNKIVKGRNKLQCNDYDEQNRLVDSFELLDAITTEIINATGGSDSKSMDDVRRELMTYIQSRDSIVSETDFENLLSKYTNDGDFLFKKTSLSENTIGLYARLLNDYNQPVLTHTVNLEKENFDLVSTVVIEGREYSKVFKHVYDSDLNLYKSFITYDEILFYPNEVIGSINNEWYYVKLLFDAEQNRTSLLVLNQKNTINTKIQLTSPELRLNNFEFHLNTIFYISGDVRNKITLTVAVNNLILKFVDMQNSFDVSDSIMLRTFKNRVLDVPLIERSAFSKNKKYYLDTIKSLIDNSYNVRENRMITDDLQFKLINSSFVPSNFVKAITKQHYDFNIQLPFKLFVGLVFHPESLIVAKTIISKLRIDIANYLESHTGTQVNIYETQLIDLCHNYPEIKSVEIRLVDSNNQVIPNSNIESIPKSQLSKVLSKEEYLDYTPIYWWVDINSITIVSKSY